MSEPDPRHRYYLPGGADTDAINDEVVAVLHERGLADRLDGNPGLDLTEREAVELALHLPPGVGVRRMP